MTAFYSMMAKLLKAHSLLADFHTTALHFDTAPDFLTESQSVAA
jgi:hypothetical protein